MWEYHQNSGAMKHAGVEQFHGYAGGDKGLHPEGKNNSSMQAIKGVGPLPRGIYVIGPPYQHPHLGPFVMNLDPNPANEMFGRSLFRIHGDSIANPGNASNGCIVLARAHREAIWNSGDHDLMVCE